MNGSPSSPADAELLGSDSPEACVGAARAPAVGLNRSRLLKRNVFTLAMGETGATAIVIVLSSILTRQYSPEAFGPVTLLMSMVGVFGVFGTLSYARAIPLARSRVGVRGLFVLSLAVAVAMTMLVALLLLFFGSALLRIFDDTQSARYLPFLPLLFLINGLGSLITISLNCEQRFIMISARRMIDRGGSVLCQIVLGVTSLANTPLGLILGYLLGVTAGAVFGLRAVVKSVFSTSTYRVHPLVLLGLARKYRRLPLFDTWTQFVAASSLNAPVLVMGAFFPLQTVAFYSLAHRILKLPSSLFTMASGQVYYVEVAQLIASGQSAAPATITLLRLLSTISAFPITFLLCFAPPLFGLAFGGPWREAGVYAQLLTPWIAITTIGAPLSGLLPAQQRFREALGFTIALLGIRVAALLVGCLYFGPRVAIALLTGAGVLLWIQYYSRILKLAGVSRWFALQAVVKEYAVAAAFLAPGVLTYWVLHHDPAAVVLGSAGVALYAGCFLRWHPAIPTMVLSRVRSFARR